MAEVKNYGLSGVHRTLQLGKQGPVLVGNADTDSFTVTLQDGTTLTTMSGANATDSSHFITKAQLDTVYTEAQFLSNVNYNDSSPVSLGTISSGTKTVITTFEVGTSFNGNAVITVGTSDDNSLLMSDNYAEIEVAGTYQTINVLEFTSNTTLNIYVTQGGASQGAGTVLVSVVDGPVVNGTVSGGGGGGSGITLTDLSVTTASPSGNGSLSYDNTTGEFTFTPVDNTGHIVFEGDALTNPTNEAISLETFNGNNPSAKISVTDYNAVSMKAYEHNTSTFTTSDWTTATWNRGEGGYIVFTVPDGSSLYDFMFNGPLNNAENIKFTFEGSEGAIDYNGWSGNSNQFTLWTGAAMPAEEDDGVAIGSIEFTYNIVSQVLIDYDEGDFRLDGRGLDIRIDSSDDIGLYADVDMDIEAGNDLRLYANDTFSLVNRSNTEPIEFIVDSNNASKTWRLNVNGTLQTPGFLLPAVDGTEGQVLTTDGAGNVTWVTPSSGESVAGYKGFKAHYGRMYGNDDDPNGPIDKIVIYQETVTPSSTIDASVEDDDFEVTGLSGSGVVAMIVAISDNVSATDIATLKTFAESIIDNVILDGGVEGQINSAADMKTAFYDNFATFSAIMPELKENLNFLSYNDQFSINPAFFTGKGASFNSIQYNIDDDTLTSGSWGQGPGSHVDGDIFVIPGDTIQDPDGNYLSTPANDITITVTSTNAGYIQNFTVTGTLPRPAVLWPNNSISDGGDDEYDTGNYINTNLESQISYNDGNVVTSSSAVGGGDYVVTYKDGIFGFFVANAGINSIGTSGGSGFDGTGQADTGSLYGAGSDNTIGDITVVGTALKTDNGTGPWWNGVISLMPGSNNEPQYATYGQFINIYPTWGYDEPHIHIAAGTGANGTGDMILGDDNYHIDVNHDGQIYIKTDNQNYTWTFDNSGHLTLPNGGDIKDSNGISVIVSNTAEPRFDVYSNTMNIGTSLNRRYAVDTTNTATTISLPSNPQMGDTFFVADAGGAFATNNLTIDRNGMTIDGASSNVVLNTNGASIGMFWNGNTWRTYQ